MLMGILLTDHVGHLIEPRRPDITRTLWEINEGLPADGQQVHRPGRCRAHDS